MVIVQSSFLELSSEATPVQQAENQHCRKSCSWSYMQSLHEGGNSWSGHCQAYGELDTWQLKQNEEGKVDCITQQGAPLTQVAHSKACHKVVPPWREEWSTFIPQKWLLMPLGWGECQAERSHSQQLQLEVFLTGQAPPNTLFRKEDRPHHF